MSLRTCSSCGLRCIAIVVLKHQRKGESAPVEWVIGHCCYSELVTAPIGPDKATSTKGRT